MPTKRLGMVKHSVSCVVTTSVAHTVETLLKDTPVIRTPLY